MHHCLRTIVRNVFLCTLVSCPLRQTQVDAGKRWQSGVDSHAHCCPVQFSEKSHKLQNILETKRALGQPLKQTVKPMALSLQGHMAAEWHTCVEPCGPCSCATDRWSKRSARGDEAQVHSGACAGPGEKPWIGKIIFTPPRCLRTPAPSKDPTRERTTTTARRRASTWAGRATPYTLRPPWGPLNRPACLTSSLLLTVYLWGRNRVYPSSTIPTGFHSSSPLLGLDMERLGSRTDITSLFPGWKPPNLTHTPGRDSGQVIPP